MYFQFTQVFPVQTVYFHVYYQSMVVFAVHIVYFQSVNCLASREDQSLGQNYGNQSLYSRLGYCTVQRLNGYYVLHHFLGKNPSHTVSFSSKHELLKETKELIFLLLHYHSHHRVSKCHGHTVVRVVVSV